jgi:hypothetical protein
MVVILLLQYMHLVMAFSEIAEINSDSHSRKLQPV